jgi:hypothetical protein
MAVIRRIDAILEPTKEAVLRMKEQLDNAKIANQHAARTAISFDIAGKTNHPKILFREAKEIEEIMEDLKTSRHPTLHMSGDREYRAAAPASSYNTTGNRFAASRNGLSARCAYRAVV